MTSNNALSQFADLSPEQRQLLFEKIRQKKLNSARRPVSSSTPGQTDPLQLSPHQQCLLSRIDGRSQSRLVELVFTGALSVTDLQDKMQQLQATYPMLSARFNPDSHRFTAGDGVSIESVQLGNISLADARDQIEEIRSQLQRRSSEHQALILMLVQQGTASHLFLACHPLLLDGYSLLRLGNQLLAMLFTPIDQIELPAQCTQEGFANWSSQVLDKPFLTKEWTRLAPKALQELESTALCYDGHTHTEQLDTEFLEAHLPSGQSAKQWLCDAINRCLHNWLAHQDITYWFSDPSLKDSAFENLLGFFPYYVPMQAQKFEGQVFNAANQFANLHTRFSPVSEQLAHHLCQSGAPVPLVHYHWFDVDGAEAPDLDVLAVRHCNAGLMLAPFEIHIIEQVQRIDLSIHYDAARMGRDQIQFLVRDLLALLKQDHQSDQAQRPSLPDQLRNIWKDLLQVTEIAPQKSFFELGGHSLQVTEMKFRIKQQLKLDIPISVLYELPTIEKLSSFILATHGNSLGWVPEGQTQNDEEEEGTL